MVFLYSKWLELPLSTRHKIASEFGIVKKGSTEVYANTIKADGYLLKDIENALTLNNLQNYLGTTETELITLWKYLVDKVEGRNIVLADKPIVKKNEKKARAKK